MQADEIPKEHTYHKKHDGQAPVKRRTSSATSLKPITVYDLDAYFHAEHQMEAFRYKQVAIFEGEKGIVLAEAEAVHKIVDSLSDTVDIPVNKLPEPGKVWLIANYMCTISIDEILKAPSCEMPFVDFFKRRDYNPRCQSNFKTLLQSLTAIEFDLSDYFPHKEPLSKQLIAAETRAKNTSVSKHLFINNDEKNLF